MYVVFTHSNTIRVGIMKLTRDEAGTPISSTTSWTMLSKISCETLMLTDSVNSLSYWWDVIPISWGCQSVIKKNQRIAKSSHKFYEHEKIMGFYSVIN